MKKLLLFVIVLFALMSIDHPVIKEPRDKLLGTVMTDLSESSQVKHEVKAKKALASIRDAISLNSEQDIHITQNLRTNANMFRWEKQYCINKELNEFFYGDDLLQICQIIAAVPK
ncbi:hypothetical protein AAEU32_06625 [Pseudoalteromonas sp. SSDWG2]|uniref:hypothetical protein n=1 Tax=Pseudoalteromonas sp. SSDWG2 TaxID=3139391 RepID=UPI003BAD351B